ncbi:MAG TPA: universal stress protein [Streptosporangiaceae bacterium]
MNQEQRQRIVVGVQGSPASLAALRWAGREAGLRDTKVQVVRAWEHDARRVAPYAVRSPLLAWEEDRLMAGAQVEEAVRATLGPSSSVDVSVEVADGLAARVLLDRAAGAELLVLGSGGSSAPGGIGPVARACLRSAPCPVVVVSAERVGALVPA